MLKNRVKIVLRSITKNRLHSSINIVRLSAGILVMVTLQSSILQPGLKTHRTSINHTPEILLAAIVITVIIISFQAIKAAIANPVKSLRTE